MRAVTVSQLNSLIKRILQTDPLLTNLTVRGELSNLKYHSNGHVYFTLKDSNSRINCFLPADVATRLRYELIDEMEVILAGYISVYEKGGSYSLNVRDVSVEGEGNLAVAFRLLKEKLEAEGLFDTSGKKSLPAFPHKLAIVTSPTGAAITDMLRILCQRTQMTDIRFFPCLVQGNEAAADICQTLDLINCEYPDTEVILLGRGGGSLEDLWAFNEEAVARAIARSNIPIISAVGHEQDFTISDLAADLRAATPTHAAELAVPDQAILRLRVQEQGQLIEQRVRQQLRHNRLRLDRLNVDNLLSRLTAYLRDRQERNEQLYWQMNRQMIRLLSEKVQRLHEAALKLAAADPTRVLKRGYAEVRDKEGNPLTTVEASQPGDLLTLILLDGKINCYVQEIWRTSHGKENTADI